MSKISRIGAKSSHVSLGNRYVDSKQQKDSKREYLAAPTYKRLQVLLDLDNTVISSLRLSKPGSKDEIDFVPVEYQKQFRYIDMKNYYRIFERPFLQVFLDYLFANFDVSVFTAADKDYALFIVDNIILSKPERKVQYMFFGYHSGISEDYFKSPKDLRLLWDIFGLKNFTACSTVIIDDLPDVYENNPNNSIIALKFEILDGKKRPNFDAVNDTFLLSAVGELEKRRKKFEKNPCLTHVGNRNQGVACGSMRGVKTK